MHLKPALLPAFVPFEAFSRSERSLHLTTNVYVLSLITGTMTASLPILLDNIKVETNGTITLLNAGFGEGTVRAQIKVVGDKLFPA